MLKARFLTACVLVPLVAWLLFFASPFVFLQATIVILLLASWEWSRLIGLTHLGGRLLYAYVVCFFQAIAFVADPMWVFSVSAVWWCIAFCLILFYPRCTEWNSRVVRGVMGGLVLIPCVIALNVIRSWYAGSQMLFFLLLLIWIADIAAYFVGRRFGVTKLAPAVSPGKSVQGLIGALVASFLYVLIFLFVYDSHAERSKLYLFLFLSIACVIFSVVGDLFESMIKREAGVKDSGKLLPGHGGILDRIDSLTAAAPLFALGMMLLRY